MSAMSDYLESGIIDHLLRTITYSKPSNISIALLTPAQNPLGDAK